MGKLNHLSLLFLFLFLHSFVLAKDLCPSGIASGDPKKESQTIADKIATDCDTIFPDITEAIAAQTLYKKPVKMIDTQDSKTPTFPSYSQCEKSFFRVATVNKKTDQNITSDGWKSGWTRREEELKNSDGSFDGLPPSQPIEDRIIQYVRVKNVPSEFPKHSTIIGVLENPIRTLSVGYHTGYNSGLQGNHMRMDEIEVGPCAQKPECQKIQPVDSTEVFKKKGLIPRYSTEGEWAIDRHVPSSCVVATYRIKFGKVDDKCYSDVNKNCAKK